jgi:hypothetical protein
MAASNGEGMEKVFCPVNGINRMPQKAPGTARGMMRGVEPSHGWKIRNLKQLKATQKKGADP